MAPRAPRLDPDALQRVVVRVQSDLDGDLSLASLAAEAGSSRAHFQRAFTATVGESPADHVARIRVERAAYLLCVSSATALSIALSVGFRNPDTFTRAFRRRFACTPRAWRRRRRFSAQLAAVRAAPGVRSGRWSLSPTRVVPLRPLRIAFLRHVGPYESVDPSLWVRLVEWARRRGVTHGHSLGIGHDAPGVTPADRLRFDAGIVVAEPVRPSDGVGVQTLGPARFAVTTHVGPYATLPDALREIFVRSSRLAGHRLVGLPCVEIYHDATVDPRRRVSATDVHLPVERTH